MTMTLEAVNLNDGIVWHVDGSEYGGEVAAPLLRALFSGGQFRIAASAPQGSAVSMAEVETALNAAASELGLVLAGGDDGSYRVVAGDEPRLREHVIDASGIKGVLWSVAVDGKPGTFLGMWLCRECFRAGGSSVAASSPDAAKDNAESNFYGHAVGSHGDRRAPQPH